RPAEPAPAEAARAAARLSQLGSASDKAARAPSLRGAHERQWGPLRLDRRATDGAPDAARAGRRPRSRQCRERDWRRSPLRCRRVERSRAAGGCEEPSRGGAVRCRGAQRPRDDSTGATIGMTTDLISGRFPDARGRFGPFGGRYVPETLIPALERLERGVHEHLPTAAFQQELAQELSSWAGRPTALTLAGRLSERWGARIWLKREDLAHTGAHKINNAVGQALLARQLGARRIVAETGAGQHGVASAAACARLGLPCTVYMGAIDMQRQAPNVDRMRLLGTT